MLPDRVKISVDIAFYVYTSMVPIAFWGEKGNSRLFHFSVDCLDFDSDDQPVLLRIGARLLGLAFLAAQLPVVLPRSREGLSMWYIVRCALCLSSLGARAVALYMIS